MRISAYVDDSALYRSTYRINYNVVPVILAVNPPIKRKEFE